MKATTSTGKEIAGKTLNEISKKLGGMLSINGVRAITAKTENGATIRQSLYSNDSYIKSSNGRILSSW